MTTFSRPKLEQLEDRCVPVTWGNPWPDAMNLTVSFAPDGTQVGDRTSQLFQELNQVAPTAQWQAEILRALQTWAVHANINIGVVPDQGLPFGSAGRPQGDPRFGDIRIAAYPMSSEVIAISSPYESTAGTWAGDIKLNSAYNFGVNGSGGIDLYTAMLHEVAHVFGLDHSDDEASAVFAHYVGEKDTLSSEDIGRLQALYGARAADKFEGAYGNGTFGNATRLTLLQNSNGSLGIKADADVTSLSDTDFYRFQAPLNAGKLRIHVRTDGLSLLAPRLTVYDANQRVVQTVVASGAMGDDLLVEIGGLVALKTYYVKVDSGSRDAFGIGSYQLEVESIPLLGSLTSTLNTVVESATQLLNDDLHTNDSLLTASVLSPLTTQTASRFDHAFKGSIRDSWDVDFYKVQAPASTATSTVMSVMLWGMDNDGLIPKASVYDADGNLVASEIVVNENGIFVLQVINARPGATYFVKAEAADPHGAHNTGNYFLGVDFGGQPVALSTIAQGTLDASKPQQAGQLVIGQSEMFHFVLSASTGTTAAAAVRMTIYDEAGNVVTSLVAHNGQPAVSRTVTLARGVYTIRFSGGTPDGSPLPGIEYVLRGNRLSDPIGPQPESSTTAPSTYDSGSYSYSSPPSSSTSSSSTYYEPQPSTTSSPPPSSTYDEPQPTTTSSPPPEETNTYDPYYYEYSYYNNYEGDNRSLQPEDPYSDPYSTK